MSAEVQIVIGPYFEAPAACQEYDERACLVARQVGELITAKMPSLIVEHIGSTAVPDCAGKGVVDLMVLYPAGHLAAARATLDDLGFQRQSTRDPFPEERPMRTGSVVMGDKVFRLHAHVIAADAPEAAQLRLFRDRLRSDDELRQAYVARKRAIIANGVTDSIDYCLAKGIFVENALAQQAAGEEEKA
ncbi:MAG TPA: GrpB family protein [Blastocatellia bacterium]|nr:GrpB family protein [Blastocatellia bacterium]